MPYLDAPTATYVGWNIGSEGFAKGSLCGAVGSYIPFAKTKSERLKSGDPRLSIQERYQTKNEYIERLRKSSQDLIDNRFLLEIDSDLYVNDIMKRNIGLEN